MNFKHISHLFEQQLVDYEAIPYFLNHWGLGHLLVSSLIIPKFNNRKIKDMLIIISKLFFEYLVQP